MDTRGMIFIKLGRIVESLIQPGVIHDGQIDDAAQQDDGD